MRASKLALAAVVIFIARAAPAQTVIDIEGQKAAEPPVQQEVQPQTTPELQPKIQDPAQTQTQPQTPLQTQTKEAPAGASPEGGRFTFNRIDNGFLRLDNLNGQIAYCRPQTIGWSCEAVPENRSSLEADVARLEQEVTALGKLKAEIARLQGEVVSLQKELAALKEPPPPRPPADLTPPAGKGGDVTIKLPTHEDLARARQFVEKTWHRLVEMINAIQKDVMQKG
jgi:hypothetical protein